MPTLRLVSVLATLTALFLSSARASPTVAIDHVKRAVLISPKVFIISMFEPEAVVWHGIKEFDLLAQNITVPGFSPLFPDAHCTADGQICQMVTGESEINAASSVTGLVLSPSFNLTKTYFMIAGIAGVNPEVVSTASVIFARFAIQVALQFQIAMQELPANFSTTYFPQGSNFPSEYPQSIYGTEVFEVSESLRQRAIGYARTATLNDSTAAQTYRALYSNSSTYRAGSVGPGIHACDVTTSDVYFSGAQLGETFSNTTRLFTNNSGTYCATAQEDNATLESLLRGAVANKTDFSRVIVMRTGSDYERPPPGVSALDNLRYVEQGSFESSVQNIYLAGVKVVQGILNDWNATFERGVAPTNYIGDIFGSLGQRPDFGLPRYFLENGYRPIGKRGATARRSGSQRMRMKEIAWRAAAERGLV